MALYFIRAFLRWEAASGVCLFIAALVAFGLSNSFLNDWYTYFLNLPLTIRLGDWQFVKPVSFWINEGLMTLFFFLIGLELKREFLVGKLNSLSKIALPGFAALGGMIVPAFVYLLVNFSQPDTLKGWPIPVATDIAFALGVISLFGKRIPIELKLFLLTLAIFDDLGAIIIIAFYHGGEILFFPLFLGATVVLCLFLLGRLGVTNLIIYSLLGLLIWAFILQSGVHPTVAGILVAFAMPLSTVKKAEQNLHPWGAFLIMPLFAFANAGLAISGLTLQSLMDYVPLGIMLGLVIGKQVGVFSFTFFVVKKGWAALPKNASWKQLHAIAVLCGIGFTMSLFLGNLAFESDSPNYLVQVRLGVLLGSITSGMIGAFLLYATLKNKRRQV